MKKAKKSKTMLLVLLPFWLITNATSCNTEPPCNCDSFQDISEEMKGYVDFNIGDNWVYQLKQDTTIKDTLTCTNKRILDNKCEPNQIISGNANPCSRIYRFSLRHSSFEYFPYIVSESREGGYEEIVVEISGNKEKFTIDRSNIQNSTTFDQQFILPDINPSVWFNYSAINAEKSSDTFRINNMDYFPSILSTVKEPMSFEGVLDSIYITKGIGIWSYKNGQGQSWELKNYEKK